MDEIVRLEHLKKEGSQRNADYKNQTFLNTPFGGSGGVKASIWGY
jgi:hypothetical protein